MSRIAALRSSFCEHRVVDDRNSDLIGSSSNPRPLKASLSESEHEAPPFPGLLLGAADDLPVGDHVERDGELLEDGHHVPVVLRAALHVRRAPRLLNLKSLIS